VYKGIIIVWTICLQLSKVLLQYSNMVLTVCAIAGAPSAEELAKVRTRKPAPPVIAVQLADGSSVPLWNTFSDQQVGNHFGQSQTDLQGGCAAL
jgi:hypothetical protein